MQPQLQINMISIVVATFAAFVLGGLWYGPLFGRSWAKEMKFDMSKKPDPKVMMKAYGFQLLGTFLTAYVLAHSAEVWRPSVWNAGQDMPAYNYGFFSAFFTWVGFYVPLHLGSVSWEGKSWKLFAINVGYYFVMLQVVGQILAHMR